MGQADHPSPLGETPADQMRRRWRGGLSKVHDVGNSAGPELTSSLSTLQEKRWKRQGRVHKLGDLRIPQPNAAWNLDPESHRRVESTYESMRGKVMLLMR